MSKNHIGIVVVVVLVICLTILISTVILANGNFYIKNLGTSLEQDGRILNSITVDGEGRVYVKPDTAVLTFSISETSSTSEEALRLANEKINGITTSLINIGISSDDIQTSQLNIYTEYDYSGRDRVLVGQTASISLTVKVREIGDDAAKAAQAIDVVSQVDDVEINSIAFDLEDKTAAFSQARELAYGKAKQKAEDLAGDSGVSLLSPVSISEVSSGDSPPVLYTNTAEGAPVAADSTATNLQSGQLELTVNVEVIFGID